MIAIVNVSKTLRADGPHQYELRINNQVIATFIHNRQDDLQTCLRKAAAAASRAETAKLKELLAFVERTY